MSQNLPRHLQGLRCLRRSLTRILCPHPVQMPQSLYCLSIRRSLRLPRFLQQSLFQRRYYLRRLPQNRTQNYCLLQSLFQLLPCFRQPDSSSRTLCGPGAFRTPSLRRTLRAATA